MRKRILFILPSLSIGGLERVQVTIANALAKRGHSVTVLTFDKGDDLVGELNSSVRFIYKRPKYEWLKHIPKIRYYFDDGLWETRATPKALYEYYVGKEKYDVEIAFFRGRSVKIISGSTNRNSVKLAWIHSDYRYCGGVSANFKSMNDVKEAYKHFNNIIAVSNQAKESFRDTIGDIFDIHVIYNMLPYEEIIEKAKQSCIVTKRCFTAIIVGRLQEVKGIDRLLSAIKQLDSEKVILDLWIVGDGPECSRLKDIVERNDMNNIRFFGMQRNPYPFIKNADLLVCSSRFEGYNLTVAEALILGVPVLSTRCTGPVEILDDGKYGLIVENSTEGLTDGLRGMVTDKNLYQYYKKMTAEGRTFFDEESIVKQIEGLFYV